MQNDANSLLNTPVTFSIYLADLVFGWLEEQGGLAAMEQNSLRRSRLLYQAIECSEGFYRCQVEPQHRSRVSVCFNLSDESLTPRFIEEAARQGLVNLKGHAITGGIRASLYNAMPDEGVAALTAFMHAFATEHAAYV
jgi:phosphoserine aminotransferase